MLGKVNLHTLLVPFLSIVGCMGSLVRAPAGVHCGHVDPVQLQLQPARPCQHVQRRLCHVRVRVLATFAHPPKLTLHCRHIDDKFSRTRRALQERGESRYEQKRCDGVDCESLEKFREWNLLQSESPRVCSSQVNLLTFLVQPSKGEESLLRGTTNFPFTAWQLCRGFGQI